jgi:hypothetical protein
MLPPTTRVSRLIIGRRSSSVPWRHPLPGGERTGAGGRRFRLDATLPIPFDGVASLEVDLLCADARVAVELDGAQHLADPAAYRRDRRKDQLLQESGYLVLRFLAEDVGKELDLVLDAILRSLSNRLPSVPPASPLFARAGRT